LLRNKLKAFANEAGLTPAAAHRQSFDIITISRNVIDARDGRACFLGSYWRVLLGCLGVKKLTPVAHDFRAVRAMQNSGMIHSFWECFAE
jgi:hypothetical protein